ncbi:hypothetical protein HOLleu_04767 [Holothuria leucospilota]|uniref:Uncharacterized protein n=1 Tax=Holothuria leucospilota TaxID=206669 RepID=A0A9Q1CJ16_HOLLE|nr:hypothetical protein HOLleu_04767 [Holothuria leucospilota]
MTFLFSVMLLFGGLSTGVCFGELQGPPCQALQYIEFGKTGVLECKYHNFFSVIWYNSTDYVNSEPLLYFKQFVKSGPGYVTGEFDVNQNGSLLIRNVSFQHEGNFTVIKLDSPRDNVLPIYIRTIVVVKNADMHPIIDQCKQETELCFMDAEPMSNLTCYIEDVRPAIDLSWFTRRSYGDVEIADKVLVQERGFLYTTYSTTRVKSNPIALELLLCKSRSKIPFIEGHQREVLIQKKALSLTSIKPLKKLVRQGNMVKLSCTEGDNFFFVWKRTDVQRNHTDNILFGLLGNYTNSKVLLEGFKVGVQGSLIVESVDIAHENLYSCVYGNYHVQDVRTYEITIYVPPVPEYPLVNECNDTSADCIVRVNQTGTLTCFVTGIRPIVELEWRVSSENASTMIEFFEDVVTVKNSTETFDVYLTSKFVLKSKTSTRLTVECKSVNSEWVTLNLSRKVELVFMDETKAQTPQTFPKLYVIPIVVTFALTIPIGLVFWKVCMKRGTRMKPKVEDEECDPMLLDNVSSQGTSEKQSIFRQELRRGYELNYSQALKPLSCFKADTVSLKDKFIEPRVGVLQKDGTWTALKTYHEIMENLSEGHEHFILNGESGYGKTTLAIQMAYDWSKGYPEYPLRNVEILLFLNLRQLEGKPPTCKTIQQFLLPVNSTLKEQDLDDIIRNSRSTVIILDECDEYSRQGPFTLSDIIDSIDNELFQNLKLVAITSRSFQSTLKYNKNVKILKLLGLCEINQENVLQNIKLKYGDESATLPTYFSKDFWLHGLYEVPLFFSILSCMICTKSDPPMNHQSVTMFFKEISASFIDSGAKKEISNESDDVDFETGNTRLSEAAYSLLSGSIQNTRWYQDELEKLLGSHYFDKLFSSGLLVEKGERCSSLEVPRREIRFCHGIFCEWFAALHVALRAYKDNSDTLIKVMENIDPMVFQFVYRFTCGLNPSMAPGLIERLMTRYDGEELASLCFFEHSQNGGKCDEVVQTICSKQIKFEVMDSNMLQISRIKLLTTASTHKVPIHCVIINNCLRYGTLNADGLCLLNGIVLPKLETLQRLVITDKKSNLENSDTKNILSYALHCKNLETLKFISSKPPAIQPSPEDTRKNVKLNVLWENILDSRILCRLNLTSGTWKEMPNGIGYNKQPIANEKYQAFTRALCSQVDTGQRKMILTFLGAHGQECEKYEEQDDEKFIETLQKTASVSETNVSRLAECAKALHMDNLTSFLDEYLDSSSFLATTSVNGRSNEPICQDDAESSGMLEDNFTQNEGNMTVTFDTCAHDRDKLLLFCITCNILLCYKCKFYNHKSCLVVEKNKIDDQIIKYQQQLEKELDDTEEELQSLDDDKEILISIDINKRTLERINDSYGFLHDCLKIQAEKSFSTLREMSSELLNTLQKIEKDISLLKVSNEETGRKQNLEQLQDITIYKNRIIETLKQADDIMKTLRDRSASLLFYRPSFSGKLALVTFGYITGTVRLSKTEVVLVYDQRNTNKPSVRLVCVSCENSANVIWSKCMKIEHLSRTLTKNAKLVVANRSLPALDGMSVFFGCGRSVYVAKVNVMHSSSYIKSLTSFNIESEDDFTITGISVPPMIGTGDRLILVIDNFSHTICKFNEEYTLLGKINLNSDFEHLTAGSHDGDLVFAFSVENEVKLMVEKYPSAIFKTKNPPLHNSKLIPKDMFFDGSVLCVLWVIEGGKNSEKIFKIISYRNNGSIHCISCTGNCKPYVQVVGISHFKNEGIVSFSNGTVTCYETIN